MTNTLSEIFSRYGFPSKTISAIAPAPDSNGTWRVMFSFEAGDPILMDVGHAVKLSQDLRYADELDLSAMVESVAFKTRSNARSNKK